MVRVTAGWALFGKRPGSSDDYGVLNCSREPFRAAEFEAILRRYALGTPPVHREGEDALPWVAVSWVGKAPNRYLGMSIQRWSDHRDGAGRPIAFTTYICVPYREVERAPVSYEAMYRALRAFDPPMDGPGEMATLDLDGYSADDLAGAVDRHDRERVARTAAMLLVGNVDVLHAGESSVLERLRFLDAVAALLPYGYRADFSAATWATGRAPNIRLAFTRRPREGSRQMPWRGPVEPGPLPAVAGEYTEQVSEIWRRYHDLPKLLGYLASKSVPREFRDPSHAVVDLADLDRPLRLLAVAERGGTPGADAARELLSGPRLAEIPADRHGTLVERLLRGGDPGDLDLADEYWERVPATDRERVRRTLAAAARDLLWTAGGPDPRVSRYVAFARRDGMRDAFLADLLRRHSNPARDNAAARAHAAELLRDAVDPRDGSLARSPLVAAVGGVGGLAAALLAAEAAAPERLDAWLHWFGVAGLLPDVVPLFRNLLDQREPDRAAVRGLVRSRPVWAAALLRAAGRLGRLDLALPGVLDWLGERSGGRGREDSDAAVVSALLTLETSQVAGCGAADALLLALEGGPRFFAAARGGDWAEYARGLAWAWQWPLPPATRRTQIRGLERVLLPRPWSGDTTRADEIINLVRALVAHSADADWSPVARVLDRDPMLEGRPAFHDLKALLGQATPAYAAAPREERWPFGGESPSVPQPVREPEAVVPPPAYAVVDGATDDVADAVADAVADDVVDQVLDYFLAEFQAVGIAAVLAKVGASQWQMHGTQAASFVRRARRRLAESHGEDYAESQAVRLVEHILKGDLGSHLVPEFRGALAEEVSRETAFQMRLLGAAVRGSEEPQGRSRGRLEESRAQLDQILKQGRGSLLPWRRSAGEA
ncbi:hypothetical protein GCM10009678_88340 [Actinomadura kijaniata]|uniref:hypothetical protein n=1 Tax=Actinomadura kijaniata TaxID=46161 RepID=UPI002FEAEEB0